MKTTHMLMLLACLIWTAACKQPKAPEPTPEKDHATVTIEFKNQVDGDSLKQGQIVHTNASGNPYSIDLLKYFVTNVVLVREDGFEFKLNNYDLINAFDPAFSNVVAPEVPNGHYTSMKFMLGIDSLRNHTGAQDGDLDPVYNMIWTWSTGYIFFKHEGTFKDTSNTNQVLQFHLGTDKALSKLQIPIDLNVAGANKVMNIAFNLNKMYNSPAIDFNVNNIHMSDKAADGPWIANMVANTNDAFSFLNTQ